MNTTSLCICEVCGYSTNDVSNYKRHISKATPCKKKEFACEKCTRSFSSRKGLLRHIAQQHDGCDPDMDISCASSSVVSYEDINAFNPVIKELIEQLKELRHEVRQIKKDTPPSMSNAQTVSGDGNTVISNNQNININLMPFGNERMDHILPWMLINALRDPKAGMTDLLQLIHYHDEVPENHNITIPNVNKPFALVMGCNGQWLKRNKTEVIDQMLNKSHYLMQTFLKKGDISRLDEDEVTEAINYLNNINPRRDPKGWVAQRSETELVILNNRSKVHLKRGGRSY